MKKLNYLVIVLITVFALSCKNKNETPPVADAPTITASDFNIIVGETANIDFTVTAPGNVASVTVSATAGTASIVDATSIVGKPSGVVTVTYVAPLTEQIATITLTVKDQQATPLEGTVDVKAAVSLIASSSSELLVAKFATAPNFDGEVDDMWNTAQRLVSKVAVPSSLGDRNTYYNESGIGEETLDIFEAYEGEEYPFSMRAGYVDSYIYFLIEWEDAVDSKDRQSWYFDETNKLWKQEHKYANDANDKYYEDKFAFLFPIGTVDGFSSSTCYATCHSSGGVITNPKDKHTRHYLKTPGQKIDMWHWKRVRGQYAGQVDDQRIVYKDDAGGVSATNGRGGDVNGASGYSDNKITLNNGSVEVTVPKYVIPGQTDYFWIDADQITAGTAKEVKAVDVNGVLTFTDDSTLDPNGDAGYARGTGNKRVPSVSIKAFTGARADIDIKYMHTGTGWVCEVKRKLNTQDDDDVVFDPTQELDFGFAIFNNAAIGHAIKPGLKMKFEQ